MTNVPENIRNIWTEMYKLFDRHYLMENKEEAWNNFWKEAEQIFLDNGQKTEIAEALTLIATVIGERMKNGQKAQ